MTLDRYLVKQFFPFFLFGLCMFAMIVVLIDLFGNLWRYLNYEVPPKQILLVCLLYLPKCLSYALPVALLFAVAYTLGDLYARNELTAIFSSGIPFFRFCLSLVFIGGVLSIGSFFFEDRVVIPTLKQKNDLSRLLLHQQRTESNSDIVIKADNGRRIYSVDFFDTVALTLNGVSIIEQSDKGDFISLIRAPRATWTGEYWVFSNALIYEWINGILRVKALEEEGANHYRESPETFRRSAVEVESLRARDAALLAADLRAAGLPFTTVLAEYYHRYSFPTVSLVVIILSISMGGRFKKNILLMSLIASLGTAVIFYIIEMISMMMARLGHLSPIAGAWVPVITFLIIGILLTRSAKT